MPSNGCSVIKRAYGHAPLYRRRDRRRRLGRRAAGVRRTPSALRDRRHVDAVSRQRRPVQPVAGARRAAGRAAHRARRRQRRRADRGAALRRPSGDRRAAARVQGQHDARARRPADASWRRFDKSVRNQIRKAERAGLTVECGGPADLAAFYDDVRRADARSGIAGPRLRSCDRSSSRSGRARASCWSRGAASRLAASSRWPFKDRLVVPWATCRKEYFALCPEHAPLLGNHPDRVPPTVSRASTSADRRGIRAPTTSSGSGARQEEPLFWYRIPIDGARARVGRHVTAAERRAADPHVAAPAAGGHAADWAAYPQVPDSMTLRVAFIGAGQMARQSPRTQSRARRRAGQHRRRPRSGRRARGTRSRRCAGTQAYPSVAGAAGRHAARRRPRLHAAGARMSRRRTRRSTRGAHVYVEKPFALTTADAGPAARSRRAQATDRLCRPSAAASIPRSPRSLERAPPISATWCRSTAISRSVRQAPACRAPARAALAPLLVDILPHPLYSLIAVLERFGPPDAAVEIDWARGGPTDLHAIASRRRRDRPAVGQPARAAGRLVADDDRHARRADLRSGAIDRRRRGESRRRGAREGAESRWSRGRSSSPGRRAAWARRVRRRRQLSRDSPS